MRYLAGFVFFALALGTLRLAGCGDGDDVECESDADCDDGDPCTSEFCRLECSFVSHSTGCNPDSSPEPDCITNVCVYSSTPHAVCADGRICLVPDGYVAEAHLVCANPLCLGCQADEVCRYGSCDPTDGSCTVLPIPSERGEFCFDSFGEEGVCEEGVCVR